MNDHTIFIRRKTRVDASVLILGIVNIKSVFSYFTPSPRERGRGRSSPFNLRWGISKKVALQPCLFTQKASYLPWWGLGESGGTYIQGKNKNKQTNKQIFKQKQQQGINPRVFLFLLIEPLHSLHSPISFSLFPPLRNLVPGYHQAEPG